MLVVFDQSQKEQGDGVRTRDLDPNQFRQACILEWYPWLIIVILLCEIEITLQMAIAQKEPDKINTLYTIKILGIKVRIQ